MSVWSLTGLSARRGSDLILDRVDLTVTAGEVLGVVGPNGAGKTSLLRGGLGLMPMSAGRALLGETPVGALKPESRARLVGYLPQERRVAWNLVAEQVASLGAPDLPPLQAGDLVVFTGAGAYGAVMSSEYNTRPLVAEVMVDGGRWALIRPRPTYDEMLAAETAGEWL